MAIQCDRLKTVFFVPSVPGIGMFKLFLYELNNPRDGDVQPRRRPKLRFIEKQPGYGNVPFDEAANAVPDGYKKVAVTLDPADLVVHTWRKLGVTRTMKQRGDFEAIRDAGLQTSPSFSYFVKNRDSYAAHSIHMATAQRVEFALGKDLGFYDEVLRIDRAEDVAAFFAEDDWAQTPDAFNAEAVSISIPAPRGLLPSVAAGLMDDLSGRYEGDNPDFERSKSQIAQIAFDAPAPVPVLQRGEPVSSGLHVVCMLKETPDVVARFVLYYRALGCDTINLYFDDPDDPAADQYHDQDDVVVTRCTDEFWEGKRKASIAGRQIICYNRCYARLDTPGWLIVCDSDEFVTSRPDTTFAEMVEALEPEQRVVRFNSAEAVWRSDSTDLSLCSAPYVRRQVTQVVWHETREKKPVENWGLYRKGLLSHGSGKYMVRLGYTGLRLQTHKVHFDDGYNSMRLPQGSANGILVHFYALSYDHWKRKSQDRVDSASSVWQLDDARQRQVDLFQQSQEEGRRKVFLELYGIGEEEAAALSNAGILFEIKIFDGLPGVTSRPQSTAPFQSRRGSSSQFATAPDEA